MQNDFANCKFLREILKLIKGTQKHGDQDIEAGEDSFKKQFTKAWIPREIIPRVITSRGVKVQRSFETQGQGKVVTVKSDW